MKKQKALIGRSDIIDLPDFDLTNIKAKIDTGAYTSALHCSTPKIVGKKISFYLLNRRNVKKKKIILSEYSQRNIKNSFGHSERRYIIKTTIKIFDEVVEAEFSLSNRETMRHPLLLGRKFLKAKFIVDVSKFNLSYKQKKKKSKMSEINKSVKHTL